MTADAGEVAQSKAGAPPLGSNLAERRTVLVMGGLARLARLYQLEHSEHRVVVANTDSRLIARQIESFDAVVVVPTNLSHQAARRVLDGLRRTGVVVLLAPTPGVGTVRKTIEAALRAAA